LASGVEPIERVQPETSAVETIKPRVRERSTFFIAIRLIYGTRAFSALMRIKGSL